MLHMAPPAEGPQSPILSLSPIVMSSCNSSSHNSSSHNSSSPKSNPQSPPCTDPPQLRHAPEAAALAPNNFVSRSMTFDHEPPALPREVDTDVPHTGELDTGATDQLHSSSLDTASLQPSHPSNHHVHQEDPSSPQSPPEPQLPEAQLSEPQLSEPQLSEPQHPETPHPTTAAPASDFLTPKPKSRAHPPPDETVQPPHQHHSLLLSSPTDPDSHEFEQQSCELCPTCQILSQTNDQLERRLARLRMRLQDSIETSQTHGQRLLRAAFQDKLREMTTEHAHRTTEMLNIQKKCFEDELEVMEAETKAAVQTLQQQLANERDERDQLIFRYETERDDAMEKTQSTMQAIQRKLTQMHARATRLDREKQELASAYDQKQLMIEVLASTAAAKDVERHRLIVLENGQEEERKRKNSLIDSLQIEVADLRKRLEAEADNNRNMSSKFMRLEKERRDESQQYADDLEDCKQESKREIDRMGQLFASMFQDFSLVPSDVSATD